ncbi:hypothetical protein [Ruegeria lacuscaerulensis]|uniref:hypothetical protein n=1 Tax=Ruegeria lacuscaerulensis TaxID=55218 RepID=UPI00147B20F7|nr:hypothetical protein [Ruegeria lacuscaerulensis]
MFDDVSLNGRLTPAESALLLFDRAMRIQAIRADIVRAAQYLDGFSDRKLSELGINRSDIETTIDRYI